MGDPHYRKEEENSESEEKKNKKKHRDGSRENEHLSHTKKKVMKEEKDRLDAIREKVRSISGRSILGGDEKKNVLTWRRRTIRGFYQENRSWEAVMSKKEPCGKNRAAKEKQDKRGLHVKRTRKEKSVWIRSKKGGRRGLPQKKGEHLAFGITCTRL